MGILNLEGLSVESHEDRYDLINRNNNKTGMTRGGIAEVLSLSARWVKTAPPEMAARIPVATVFKSPEISMARLQATSYTPVNIR